MNLTKGTEERALRARSSSMRPSQVIPVLCGHERGTGTMNRHSACQLAAVFFLSLMAGACGPYRSTHVYHVPPGYVGWVEIKYGDSTCPPLPVEGDLAVRRVPPSGILCTSTPLRKGWGSNHYYEVGSSKVEIPTSGAPTDRRIWSPMSGEMSSSAGTHLTEASSWARGSNMRRR
jgi:hypothetical protein